MQLSFADYLLYSLLGICVVFLVLVSLIVIIKLLTWATDRTASAGSAAPVAAPATAAPAGAPASAATPTAPELAPGSAGELRLNGVEPRTAAMLMAIVADELGVPLNELRFISIKEVDR